MSSEGQGEKEVGDGDRGQVPGEEPSLESGPQGRICAAWAPTPTPPSPITKEGGPPPTPRPHPRSLVAVVVELVVAAQGRQAPLADGKGEEDLGARVHPHLRERGPEEVAKRWGKPAGSLVCMTTQPPMTSGPSASPQSIPRPPAGPPPPLLGVRQTSRVCMLSTLAPGQLYYYFFYIISFLWWAYFASKPREKQPEVFRSPDLVWGRRHLG